jgi:Transposase DDE domain
MVIRSDILDCWPDVRARLPASFDIEKTARVRGAFTRAREIESAETLLRLALAYGGCGMSLRITCAWAEAAGIASLADPSLLERLVKAAPWLGDLVAALIAERAGMPARRWAGHRLRVIDATTICQPGADGTTWRLHAGYDLASGQIDHIELTDARGPENLQRLTYQPGDVGLGDRGYARPRDLRPVIDAGADFIVRTGWNSLCLLTPDGTDFDLFATLAAQQQQTGEVLVRVDEGTKKHRARRRRKRGRARLRRPDIETRRPLILRLIIWRKDPQQVEAEQKRLLKKAQKACKKKPDPRSLEAAKYVLLLTSLPADTFSAADVLALYRFRWQIELAFKRMKSLAGLAQLPAKNPDLARAWIYARLIVALLAEQMAGQVPESPPCGPGGTAIQPIALAPRENGARNHYPCHPWAIALANHQQGLRQNLPLHL